jgi:hypothetical protein
VRPLINQRARCGLQDGGRHALPERLPRSSLRFA